MSQLSLFSADLTPPQLSDLGGLLAAHGQIAAGAGGFRLSILLADQWRAEALLRECRVRDVTAEVVARAGELAPNGQSPTDRLSTDPLSTDRLRTDRLSTDQGSSGSLSFDPRSSDLSLTAAGTADLNDGRSPANESGRALANESGRSPANESGRPPTEWSPDHHPSAGSPSAGSPSAGPPSAGPPSAGPPSAGSPSAGSPSAGPRLGGSTTIVFRSERTSLLATLAGDWTRGAIKAVPAGLTLTPGLLRCWTIAAGQPASVGFLLGLDPHAPDTYEPLAAVCAAAGLAGSLLGIRGGGPAVRIVGYRRCARLAEMIGTPPPEAPRGAFPALSH